MNDITIGIPKALMYYRYKYLWLSFFKELRVNVLVSEYMDFNNKLLSEVCIPLKTYFGHVNYLIDKVDYVLVPRILLYESCDYFSSLYDIINNTFDVKLLDYNIDKNTEELAFLKMGQKLGFGKEYTLGAYHTAKKEEYRQNKINYLLDKKRLNGSCNSILLISENYICEDILIKDILDIFKNNNFNIINSNYVNPDDYFDENTYKKAKFNKIKNCKDIVNGILIITTSPCVCKNIKLYSLYNSLDNTLLININELNDINLLNKKIDSFIDNIKMVGVYE